MNRFAVALSPLIVVTAMGFDDAWGQLPSVVQLPSFQTFSFSGSVVVPDGGTTSLGGVGSSAIYSQRRPTSRSFGSSLSNSHASVSARIIDLNEMDRQILGASPQELLHNGQPNRPRAIDPVEEGKALVRHARRQYREGEKSGSFVTYQMAIGILNGQLRELAVLEFRRVFGEAADQSLSVARNR